MLGTSSSHLFLHILAPFDKTPEETIAVWNELMPALISRYATRLLKLRVDEIEVRAHARNADGSRQAIRLVASSMAGQWLKTDGYLEYLDPVTGATQAYCSALAVGYSEGSEEAWAPLARLVLEARPTSPSYHPIAPPRRSLCGWVHVGHLHAPGRASCPALPCPCLVPGAARAAHEGEHHRGG